MAPKPRAAFTGPGNNQINRGCARERYNVLPLFFFLGGGGLNALTDFLQVWTSELSSRSFHSFISPYLSFQYCPRLFSDYFLITFFISCFLSFLFSHSFFGALVRMQVFSS